MKIVYCDAISPQFVSGGLIDNNSSLVRVMALQQTSYKITWFTDNDASTKTLNTLRPRQNGRHFADDSFNRIFINENVKIAIEFSLKFVPKGPINNIPALVQIIAWHRPGDKPLSEPVMVSLLTHICVTLPQWVNNNSILSSLNKTARHR